LSALQDEPCRLRIAHAHCLQFERSGMVLMSHNREASKVTVNSSYFHPAHQHYTDEAHKAETVPSVVIYIYIRLIYLMSATSNTTHNYKANLSDECHILWYETNSNKDA
jgi:hypothetical protein